MDFFYRIMFPQFAVAMEEIQVSGVAVQRTARVIMEGTVYIPR